MGWMQTIPPAPPAEAVPSSPDARLRGCFGAARARPPAIHTARADEPVAPRRAAPDERDGGGHERRRCVRRATDPFDLNLMIGFEQTWKNTNIRRETNLNQTGLSTGGFVAGTENIATYNQQVSTLNMGADVGIYRDLAVVFRLPLILADNRALGPIAGGGAATYPQLLADPAGGTLFRVPFKSPTRSGVDFFSVGLDWALFNQQRDWTKPTWLVGVTGRFGVGNPLHACNANAPAGQPQCPDPTQQTAGQPLSGPSRDPGISRAMDGLEIHTYFSRRYGYVEPYTGFTALVEFAQGSSDFGQTKQRGGRPPQPPALPRHVPRGDRGHSLGAARAVPAHRGGSPGRGDVPLGGPRILGALRRPRLLECGLAALAEPYRLRCGGERGRERGLPAGNSPVPSNQTGVPFTGITDQQAFESITFKRAPPPGRRASTSSSNRRGSGSPSTSRSSSPPPTPAIRTLSGAGTRPSLPVDPAGSSTSDVRPAPQPEPPGRDRSSRPAV